jgi:Bifunctional DNA primase/polymerase, N-terminal
MPIFADHAQEMRAKKLAVLPLGAGRKPHVNSFNTWRHRPGAKIVDRWAEAFPDANIGVLPGLSGKGAVVFDCDTMEAAAEFEDRFGKVDLRVATRRGVHLYAARLPFRPPGNLKKFGLDIDIKAGNQIVIAPPSIHESGHIYRLDGCDWDALHNLRSIDADKLRQFIDGLKQRAAEKQEESSSFRDPRDLRDDSRKQCVNDTVFGLAIRGAAWEECLGMVYRLNETVFASMPKGRLDLDEVFERAKKAFEDGRSGRFKPWGNGRRSVVRITREESDKLTPDALKLLAKLRAEHSVECKRGGSFPIMATRMAKTRFMSRKRIERARNELIRERLLFRVASFKMTAAGRVAARYNLFPPSPSQGGGAGAGR